MNDQGLNRLRGPAQGGEAGDWLGQRISLQIHHHDCRLWFHPQSACVMAPLCEAISAHKHPLALDSFFSWPAQPHARFHPAWCSPVNPPIRKGWRDSHLFRVDRNSIFVFKVWKEKLSNISCIGKILRMSVRKKTRMSRFLLDGRQDDQRAQGFGTGL